MIFAYFVRTAPDSISEEALDLYISRLPKERREYVLHFKRHEPRVSAALSWLLLLYLLEDKGIHHGTFDVIKGEHEKPLVEDNSFFFNISHTKGAILAAAGTSAVGADIQIIVKKDIESISKRVLNKKELMILNASQAPELDFTRLWTLKESYIKYTGDGISALEKTPDFSDFHETGGRLKKGPAFITKAEPDLFLSICADDEITIEEKSIDELSSFFRL